MQVIHPGYDGIDGYAAQRTACLRRVGDTGRITTALYVGRLDEVRRPSPGGHAPG
jgi:hypothetical protein